MGREFELKFQANAQIHQALLAQYPGMRKISMETTYYDTPQRTLSHQHITLRKRMENGTAVCTVKTPADRGGRGEWECICPDIHQAIPVLCKLGGPADLTLWTNQGLEAVCGARFDRLCREVELEGATAELALDQGVLLGNGRQIPLCEVEVEHKSGDEAVTAAFAQELALRFGLTPEGKSKFRRAMDLAQSE